jgi:hypothetical protein
VRWMLPGIILTFAPALHAQSLIFSGALEWIAPESISIRLSDGRIIDALLPKSGSLAAAPLSAGRHVGDSVAAVRDLRGLLPSLMCIGSFSTSPNTSRISAARLS